MGINGTSLNDRTKVKLINKGSTTFVSPFFANAVLCAVNYSKMIVIKLNEPQPLDCPKCKAKEGYQYSDLFRMSYTSYHNAQGKYEGGEYNNGMCLNRGVSCFCANCGKRLPFKLDRTGIQGVSV